MISLPLFLKKIPRWGLPLLGLLLLIPLALAFQYKAALPGYQYQFPRDHASHEAYKTEWWYYTGHLQTQSGKRYGYELTFFRIGNDPQIRSESSSPWNTNNLYATHFALSDENQKTFHYYEKLNRAGLNQAGARSDSYYVWNELWWAELLGQHMVLRASSPDGKQEAHLLLTSLKPPIIHGQGGVSQKAACVGCASHYYSLTRLKTEGLLFIDGKAEPVTGLSWMDHEFGSNQLSREQTGWDWFSIQLNDNTELMLYLLRREDGSIEPNSSGTVVDAQGHSRHLTLNEFKVIETGQYWTSPASKGTYPVGWRIEVPSEKLALKVTPSFDHQELYTAGSTKVAYWEGSSSVSGSRAGKPLQGQAYVEMTGYAKESVKGKL
ncbi:lipocalin-like domain-containing protein [Vampirovibrio chlorellavorus]|uniref:lipocalin-like domain-containing protein n=1 Tax=Vampirovibrio chlorellavorus TaxID=758823 RepID=UPI0026EA5CCE|nr:lipocalin-like domain-containing protein [Vampirovibrio chlorellavorus]